MLRKCGLFALSLAVLSTSLSVLFSDVSNAWSYSTQPVICASSPNLPLEHIQSEIDDFTTSWPWAIVGYKNGSGDITSYKFFAQNPETAGTFQWVHGTDRGLSEGNITTWPQYAYWLWITGSYYTISSLDSSGATWAAPIFNSGSTGSMFSGTSGDNECLALYGNVTRTSAFNTNFGLSTPVDGLYVPPVEAACSPLDVACWFTSLTGIVVDSFASLATFIGTAFTSLGNFIASALVPDDSDGTISGTLRAYFDDINSSMRSKLGVLLFPFDAITTIGEALWEPIVGVNGNLSCVGGFGAYDFCNSLIDIDDGRGNQYHIGIGSLEQNMPLLFNFVTFLLRLLLVLGMVYMLQAKYYSIVRS